MEKSIYLDYTAATPLDPKVLSAMEPYFAEKFYNPSATYLAARAVRRDVEAARASVAQILGSRPAEIIFTSGATEANNLAISGVADAYPKGKILVSAIEHESVLAPAEAAGASLIPANQDGIVDLGWLSTHISDGVVLVSVMLVNNELGSLQPVRQIAELVNNERRRRLKAADKLPIYLHTDAAQAANFLDLHVSRLGVDLMSLNGGKIYGPKQSGALYVRAGVKLMPQIVGGGQEFGRRSGTENVPGIVGFAKALSIAGDRRQAEAAKTSALLKKLEAGLTDSYPGIIINGSTKHRAPHILSATFPGHDNERLMMELDERGVQVASGSACSASSDEPSHVLKAIGLTDAAARSTLRFSLGRQITERQVDDVIRSLAELVN